MSDPNNSLLPAAPPPTLNAAMARNPTLPPPGSLGTIVTGSPPSLLTSFEVDSPMASHEPSTTDIDKWSLACKIQQELSSLKDNLATVQAIAHEATHSSATNDAFGKIDSSLKALESLQNSVVENTHITARPTSSSAAKARKLFSVAELLEKILLNLTFSDLMRVQQVDTTFRCAFKKSARLQQVMGLRATTDGPTFSPLANPFFVGRGCLVRFQQFLRGYQLAEDEIAITATLSSVNPFQAHEMPIVGTNLRKTLVCQPALTKMTVRTSCCNDVFFRPNFNMNAPLGQAPFAQVTATGSSINRRDSVVNTPDLEIETGINLGHILDETKRLRQAHRLCPNADLGQHRDDGTVDVQVYFEAVRRLKPDDPILSIRKKAKANHERLNNQTNRDNAIWEDDINAYIASKQTARDNNLPIPTLEEYHESLRVETARLERSGLVEHARELLRRGPTDIEAILSKFSR